MWFNMVACDPMTTFSLLAKGSIFTAEKWGFLKVLCSGALVLRNNYFSGIGFGKPGGLLCALVGQRVFFKLAVRLLQP